jgi:hypothetical protein
MYRRACPPGVSGFVVQPTSPAGTPQTLTHSTSGNDQNKQHAKTGGRRYYRPIPWTPERARALEEAYRTVGLKDLDNKGKGNCLLYAAMGIHSRNTPKSTCDSAGQTQLARGGQ